MSCVGRDDLALPEERRRGMLEAEARAVLSEGVDAASAKSILEVKCFLDFACWCVACGILVASRSLSRERKVIKSRYIHTVRREARQARTRSCVQL